MRYAIRSTDQPNIKKFDESFLQKNLDHKCLHKKGSKGQLLNMEGKPSPQLTSETSPGGNATVNIISQNAENVNTQSQEILGEGADSDSIVNAALSNRGDSPRVKGEHATPARDLRLDDSDIDERVLDDDDLRLLEDAENGEIEITTVKERIEAKKPHPSVRFSVYSSGFGQILKR